MKAFKSSATKEAEAKLDKKSKKENKDMSKFSKVKTPLTVIASVLLTLAVVFAGYSIYSWGHNDGVNEQKGVNAEVVKQVATLKNSEQ